MEVSCGLAKIGIFFTIGIQAEHGTVGRDVQKKKFCLTEPFRRWKLPPGLKWRTIERRRESTWAIWHVIFYGYTIRICWW